MIKYFPAEEILDGGVVLSVKRAAHIHNYHVLVNDEPASCFELFRDEGTGILRLKVLTGDHQVPIKVTFIEGYYEESCPDVEAEAIDPPKRGKRKKASD